MENESRRMPATLLSERITLIRAEMSGNQDLATFAQALSLPERTWLNYEAGVAIPGSVLLDFLALTSVEPNWLRTGEGPRYRRSLDPIEYGV